MKPSKLYEALHALIGERVPLHIWGACGVGKSQIVAQVADDLDFDFLDVRAVQLDPVDLRGLPRIKEDQTEWVPPKFLPTSGKGILFLDELTSAPQMTQAGCYQLVLDRKLGEYRLPDGWVVIAAGNPASERGVHFSMPRPLRNRFVHLELEADLNDWCKWAVNSNVRPEIIAFLRFKPDLLHTADATSDANAWPTPRSWEITIIIDYRMESHSNSPYFPQYFFSTINIVNRKHWILSCLESQKNFLQKIDGENVPCDINI